MAEPYVGEIRVFAGNFAPVGWAFCDGQDLSISEYSTLFTLIGTTYGGDGQSTFALPDLRGRLPVHMGPNPTTGTAYVLGEQAGVETVTLTSAQIPAHSHQANGQSTPGTQESPAGGVWAASALNGFDTGTPDLTMHPEAIGPTGGNQPHSNLMPYLAVNFIIALNGIFPIQS